MADSPSLPRRDPKWRALAREAALWWLVGAGIVIALCSLRDLLNDATLPYTRKIDLDRDVGWVIRHVPSEAVEMVSGGRSDTGWRMDGRQQLRTRIGEETSTFELWRTLGDGTVERGDATTSIMAWRVRRGWPWLCVEGASWQPGLSPALRDRLIVLGGGGGGGIVIPYGVRIVPFFLDALLFGMVIAIVARLPRAVERLFRRRRGLCPACAYPLRGAGICPECGWAPRAPGGAA